MFFHKPRFEIGPLRPAALAQCVEIHAQSFRRGWDGGEFRALLNDPSVRSAAALEVGAGELLGFVLSRRALEDAEILSIAVAKKARGAGVATRLLGHHIERLTELGVKSLFLEVEAGNTAALALYRRAGFRQVGERKGYYQTGSGPAATALILRRDAP